MEKEVYKKLAERLDALPNGFPPAKDGAELRILEYLFTPEEAGLTSQLRLTRETFEQVSDRLDRDKAEVRKLLKGMVRKGLIAAGRTEAGVGYGLMPFVVGIYEYQAGRIDKELASLFEDYYTQSFVDVLKVKPQVHRVIPIGESIKVDMEVRPYESASDIVDNAQAWGMLDCICRKQKALLGDPCEHPLDVCMTMSEVPNAFDKSSFIQSLTKDEAKATLQRAADAGLVHSVSNNQKGLHYICNCCTCSCGILRGMSEIGIANVVARSSFVNEVDDMLCNGCEICVDHCQFDALKMGDDAIVQVNSMRCVGCGVCVIHCPNEALGMELRPEKDVVPPPETLKDWGVRRAVDRGINILDVM